MSESAPESAWPTPGTEEQKENPPAPPAQTPILEEKSLGNKQKVLQNTALEPGKKTITSTPLHNTAKATKSPGLLGDNGKNISIGNVSPLFEMWVKQGHIKLPTMNTTAFKAYRGLFTKVASAAALSRDRTYQRTDVILAFNFLLAEADKREADNKRISEELSLKVNADAQLRAEIQAIAERVVQQIGNDGLGEITEAQLPIFRGVSTFQASKIYTNKSMGGEARNPNRTDKPSEEEAIKQTGFNDKKAQHGTIEEWSLEPKFGFATGGFMMAALVDINYVRIPGPGLNRLRGEMGVTSYADLPIEPIIWRKGNESGTPAIQVKIDDISKPKNIAEALSRALGQRPPAS